MITYMLLLRVEAKPMDAEKSSEPWARFQVGSVPLINYAKLVLGDKRKLNPKKT